MPFPSSLPTYNTPTSNETLAAGGHTALHTSEEADIIAIATKVGTGASTPTNSSFLSGTGPGTSTWRSLTPSDVGLGNVANVSQQTIMQAIYPVGCIYTEITGVTPATTFGFGIWTQYGQGQVLVGQKNSDPNFGTVGNAGGEVSHTLTSNEMPAHSHGITDPGHTHGPGTGADIMNFVGSGGNIAGGAGTVLQGTTTTASSTTGITNNNTGGGVAHNNLQPFVTVYFWLRTA